ncbi:NAD(P)-binding protein [Neolentinus lepideus HHB14362 ss-1]|uniref:D-xylose 1-dehydrogenase (NADP(+), D-xylono-1,5-lactone-forming) n=1 Tax=Neolentinus lepideus HHB14362 ss-1 TaxID=1314782 RepID=A0A165SJK8_9AGAM|nr:NAD(P)-binding protein [Neolentinus lepideus HHB14362 ss-1]
MTIPVVSTLSRVYKALYPPSVDPSPDSPPIKFGILGAARIAPIALIDPVKCHPEAVVLAVAARNYTKAEEFAKKHGIPKVYGGANGYQELIDDPELDAIYNPLPNGLHFEWTMKALAAGKHVLLEKPSADTAEETRRMFKLAEEKNLVLLEAFHYRFHPSTQRVKEIIESGELGGVKSISATLAIPRGIMKESDIRFDYSLGGGAMMDMGCYTMSCVRYLTGLDPIEVKEAKADTPIFKKASPSSEASLVDITTTAHLAFPNSISGSIMCSLGLPAWGPFKILPRFPDCLVRVECEGGEIALFNYPEAWAYHYITVQKRDGKGRKVRTEKAYKPRNGKGEEWWTTYRYQLEAFVDKLKGRTPHHWMSAEDSIANIEWIEKVYTKTGLGPRPASTVVVA